MRPPRPSLVYCTIAVLSWPFIRLLFRLRAKGLENVPSGGGFVLAANHISNLDPWALGMPLFPRRFLRFMGKSELFFPPLGQIITAAGAFPVRRGERDLQAIQTAAELVREGHLVVMFPEGTRRRKGLRKKWEARPHTGAARIAIDAGAPLVPAAVSGTDRLLRFGPLRVAYGPPIEATGDAQEVTERLMAAIEELRASL